MPDHMPIVMIPGLNATARAFREQMDTLYRFGAVIIADHRRGSTMRDIARAILDDAPPAFILGGFSMGGYVAFEILRQAPERVAKLMLIDTQARPDTTQATANRRRNIELARGGKLNLAAANTFPTAVHASNVDNSELRAIHLDMAMQTGPEAYERQQDATIGRPDSGPGLAAIKVPTLIIVGDSDQITTPEAAKEIHAGIAGSELVVVEAAGHMALLERPLRVNAAIEAFLSR